MIKEILTRSSIRLYTDKKISKSDIETILEAGRLAPSWMNVQCWHFVVVENEETKQLLSDLAYGQKQVKNASHVIICFADLTAWDDNKFRKVLKARGADDEQIDGIFANPTLYPKLKDEDMLLLRTVEQCTYPISYMTLQAQALGISSCIIGAFGNELTNGNEELYSEIKTRLNIPERVYPLAMITLGYNAKPELEISKIRKPLEEIVSYEKF